MFHLLCFFVHFHCAFFIALSLSHLLHRACYVPHASLHVHCCTFSFLQILLRVLHCACLIACLSLNVLHCTGLIARASLRVLHCACFIVRASLCMLHCAYFIAHALSLHYCLSIYVKLSYSLNTKKCRRTKIRICAKHTQTHKQL